MGEDRKRHRLPWRALEHPGAVPASADHLGRALLEQFINRDHEPPPGA